MDDEWKDANPGPAARHHAVWGWVQPLSKELEHIDLHLLRSESVCL